MGLLEDGDYPVLGESLSEFVEGDHFYVKIGVEVGDGHAYFLHIRVEDVYTSEVRGRLQVVPELPEG